ncbi:hypothetical protein [Kitasatospora purpeofusca]|uniref:hypothetical protein n=1 Tax=Kitasatospora purpeofusca TaxID=67352 RepID=UPI002A5A0C43|nr:hypothetical protein [Kitasatospora purpeofusca]MDY0814711.1 hypothetical protein [Kitasatospora purpeofusca]
MTGQTVKIAALCECGHMAVQQVNQFINRGELWWDAEFSCDSCGSYRCEHAGPGTAPDDEWRQALLAANGAARLRLVRPVPSLVQAMKVFRDVSGVSLPQARGLVEQLSSDGVVGTLAEMEFLKTRLQLRGIPVDVDR